MTDSATDRPPTAGQQDADRRGSRGLSVAEAADRLGVTPDAVRGRLHRGTLAGEKVGAEWRVFLPEPPLAAGRQDVTAREPVDRQDTAADRQGGAAGQQDTDRAGDGPLVALVADLAKRNEELAAAAALWQARAGHLEDRLRQLTAGDIIAGDGPQDAPGATGAAEEPAPGFHPWVAPWRERTSRAVDVDRPAAPWWRFWGRRR